MKTVYKYVLKITDEQEVAMPEGALILSAHAQGDNLCVWALVDNDNEIMHKVFKIFTTGGPVESSSIRLTFVGTAVMPIGLVWHVFEVKP